MQGSTVPQLCLRTSTYHCLVVPIIALVHAVAHGQVSREQNQRIYWSRQITANGIYNRETEVASPYTIYQEDRVECRCTNGYI